MPNELSIFQVEPADFPFTNIPNGSWLFLGKQKNESYDHLVNNDANFQLTITKISFLDGSVHFIRRNIRELASADEELELFPITQNLNLIFSNKSAPLLISTRTLELLGEIDLKLAREGDWRLLLSSVAVDWFSSLLYFVIYFPSQKVIQLVEWDPQSGISRSLDFLTLAQRPLLDFHHFAVSLSFSPSLITLTVYSTALDDSRSDLYVFPINKSSLFHSFLLPLLPLASLPSFPFPLPSFSLPSFPFPLPSFLFASLPPLLPSPSFLLCNSFFFSPNPLLTLSFY